MIHLYHRHGAVWCGYSITETGIVETREFEEATCGDCRVIAAIFDGAEKACSCAECAS